ncbi:MAG: MBL fold metallo-hydrolase [Promethearchaeota archaeon]
MKLTLLVDDFTAPEPNFKTGYGFSLLIELENTNVLFDTATLPSDLAYNLAAYDFSANDIDAVFLSHNHSDHTNGLPAVLQDNPNIPIFVNKDWDKPHTFKGMKIPGQNKRILPKGRQLSEIDAHLYATNSVHSFDYGSIYEHALWVVTENNIVLITGCCHPGLDKFLNDMKNLNLSVNRPLTIIGGFHGFTFKDKRAEIIDQSLDTIYPCHCTSHLRKFQKQFGEKCQSWPVGKTRIIK